MSDWAHSPKHWTSEAGAYMVTGGTYLRAHHFGGADRLTLLRDTLLQLARDYEWELQAWAVFSNHYHFIALSPERSSRLRSMIQRLHAATAVAVNRLDGSPGRKVWFQYWDTLLTYPKSYLARLNYVHNNPVHHGIVKLATDYEWCSATWFEQSADRAFYKTVSGMKTDRISVRDEFVCEASNG